MTADDLRLIGDYYWSELTECKHCGAFESAVEGFVILVLVLILDLSLSRKYCSLLSSARQLVGRFMIIIIIKILVHLSFQF